MIVSLICFLFVACAGIQLLYWLCLFPKFTFYKEPNRESKVYPLVSVIICAYNETDNLKAFLPLILKQDYPNFEVLVIDDASTDESKVVLKELEGIYSHLSVHHLSYPDGKSTIGKKNALSEGIKRAKHPLLLVTDADCYPKSDHWIKKMVSSIEGEQTIGLGYGPYEKKKGLLNQFIRFETVYTAIQYMSFSLWGMPYMGVGRNMIYKKDLFFQVGGFERHTHVASGDDDLFVSDIANQRNTSVVIDKGSYMYSKPKETWEAYFRQKSRHVTTGTHYKMKHQILLGLLSSSHLGFYLFGIISLIIGSSSTFVSIMFLGTIVVKSLVFGSIANKLNEKDLIPFIPIIDIIYILYYILLAPALFWGKTSKWT